MLGLNHPKVFAVSVVSSIVSSIIQIVVWVAHSYLDSFISHRYSLAALEILDRFRFSLRYYLRWTLQRVKGYYIQFRGLPSSRGGYQSTVRFVTGGAQSHGVTRILQHRIRPWINEQTIQYCLLLQLSPTLAGLHHACVCVCLLTAATLNFKWACSKILWRLSMSILVHFSSV